ncbi:MAG: peptidylprolyl isomerase [Thermoplasmatota archaeon]
MMRHFGVAATFLAVALAGCTDGFDGDATAVICTNLGPITIQLYPDEAPVTSQNFLDLADEGAFDDVPFHRIITGFMMQGGDVTNGDGTGGKTASGDKLPDETHPDRPHDKAGLLSMANRGGDPTTGSSQFFITFAPTPHLNGKHTVFGEVIAGMDVVERVEDEAGSRSGTPEADVHMTTVIPGTTDVSACPAPPTPTAASIRADAITAGTFHVTATTDEILVWAINDGDEAGEITWDLQRADGSAWPEGWSATFAEPTATVSGQRAQHTVLTLTVPEGTSGSFDAILATGMSQTPLTIDVALDGQRISQLGDDVRVHYIGTCLADGVVFQEGEIGDDQFQVIVGDSTTVPGFSYGMLGLQLGEEAVLTLPALLAYGDNGGPCGGKDPADIQFEIDITAFRS